MQYHSAVPNCAAGSSSVHDLRAVVAEKHPRPATRLNIVRNPRCPARSLRITRNPQYGAVAVSGEQQRIDDSMNNPSVGCYGSTCFCGCCASAGLTVGDTVRFRDPGQDWRCGDIEEVVHGSPIIDGRSWVEVEHADVWTITEELEVSSGQDTRSDEVTRIGNDAVLDCRRPYPRAVVEEVGPYVGACSTLRTLPCCPTRFAPEQRVRVRVLPDLCNHGREVEGWVTLRDGDSVRRPTDFDRALHQLRVELKKLGHSHFL
eukprot:gene2201-biopygen6770